MKAPQKETIFVVDRLEGDFAVLFTADGDHGFDLPLSALPEGVKEGWHLRCLFTRDQELEDAKRRDLDERRRRLAADDDGGDIVL